LTHGHTQGVVNTLKVKNKFPNIDVIVGNIATLKPHCSLLKTALM
jgi:hypothetical protein